MLKIDISKCTGCKKCEISCAFFHTGKICNHLSRIKVLNIYETGIDGPVVCVQCKERYCLKCPDHALTLGNQGQIMVSPTNCTLCGICEKLCPIGAIETFNDIVYVCDLCGGNPKCAAACTEGAILYDTNNKKYSSLEEIKKDIKTMNASERKHYYLQKKGQQIRKKWTKTYA